MLLQGDMGEMGFTCRASLCAISEGGLSGTSGISSGKEKDAKR